MSIRDYKITDAQINEKGVIASPDTLNGTAAENKSVFDRLTREIVAPQFNAIVDTFADMEETTHIWSSQEDNRQLAEADRGFAEAQRRRAEADRVAAETAREKAEAARTEAENKRRQSASEMSQLHSSVIAHENERIAWESGREEAENQRQQAETARAEAETARAEAETARAQAEAARAQVETARAQAEAARAEAESKRVQDASAMNQMGNALKSNEADRVAQENARRIAENQRQEAEDARDGAENDRMNAEQERFNEEEHRQSMEDERVRLENGRQHEEDKRVLAETKRAEAETARMEAETARKEAETARAEAESERDDAENYRINAEQERADEEESRLSAEKERVRFENGRQQAEGERESLKTALEQLEGKLETAEDKRVQAEAGRVLAETTRAEAETARVEAEKARAAKDAERDGKISTIADGLSALRARENVLTGSASGTVVSVEDAAAAPLCGLHIYGKSMQDGTPSPDNPVPIVSVGGSGTITVKVTGKNLLNVSKNTTLDAYGLTWTFADGLVSISGTVPENQTYPRISLSALNGNLTLPAGRYKLIVFNHGEVNSAFLPKLLSSAYSNPSGNDTYLSTSRILTLDSNYTFNGLVLSAPLSGKAVDAAYEIMVVNVDAAGAAPTSYEPYHEQLLTLSVPDGLPGIPVDSGGTYTDASGQQWVCDEVDLARGVYVQRVQPMSISSIPTVEKVEASAGYRFESECLSYDRPIIGNKMELYDFATYKSRASVSEGSRDKWYAAAADHTLRFICPDSDRYDENSMREYLNSKCPLHGLAMLQNPIERPLTDEELTAYKALTTYAPNTVVQAEGAHIALDYQRDVNIVIKNLEDAIASITTQ